ncbi:VOC family protein [Plastoroseomonas hellenica]|uniref:VOC family protein n=1 Tax=Plastoroseomonas hellenica TaxID=2687306 RepID=A0ABS5F107_9PROT|nr:VOC family protein [Plastoroseomonas hellenica]MBR0644648.1 VOC family protein [Plastoroseomonas hellenica]MBR0666238.1 VOC family protein [Plastoroseomonas hellenica]
MAGFTFDHLHLRSPDPEAAARFYVDMLGAEITGHATTPAGLRVLMSLGGITMFIEQVPAGTAVAPPAPYIGNEHIGLKVENIHAAVAAMKAKGAHFSMEPNSPRPGITIAFVDAPDGVRVELLERAAA